MIVLTIKSCSSKRHDPTENSRAHVTTRLIPWLPLLSTSYYRELSRKKDAIKRWNHPHSIDPSSICSHSCCARLTTNLSMSSSTALNFPRTGRKIVAIGRNFADHAKELGNAVPKKPMFFLKPTSSYCAVGQSITIPTQCDVHHEVELGVVIGSRASRVSEASAMNHIAGYTLAIDLTARDLQAAAKTVGEPWTVAKGFDDFTPMVPAEAIQDPNNVRIWLKVNDQMRQDGNTRDFIFGLVLLLSSSKKCELLTYEILLSF